MRKALLIFSVVVALLVLAIGSLWFAREDGPAVETAVERAADSAKVPSRPSPAGRSEILTPDSLCERLARAGKQGGRARDGVFRKIVAELSKLESESLLEVLEELGSSSCAAESGSVEMALMEALARRDRVLAADYLVSRNVSDGDDGWQYYSGMFFSLWAAKDLPGMIEWLDQLAIENQPTLRIAENELMSALLQSDTEAAIERARSYPHDKAVAVFGGAFRSRYNLFEPDETIELLRDVLGSRDHEEIVGHACGIQLHSKSWDELRAFFLKHGATPAERAAILEQAVEMQVDFREVTDEYLQSVRQFAGEEGLQNANLLTARILGTRSDRDHEDKRAVDELLGYDPDAEALRLFLELRESSIDETQKSRIVVRLEELGER